MAGSEEWKSGRRVKKYQMQQETEFSHTITRGGGTLQRVRREQRVMSRGSGWKPALLVTVGKFVNSGQRMWDVLTLMQGLQPLYFNINRPYEIYPSDDMIIIQQP